jgi:ABC-type sulfate/molybdate transport systems ATPase subunit
MTEILSAIKNFLKVSGELYYRLLLLAGQSGSGKTGILRDVAHMN